MWKLTLFFNFPPFIFGFNLLFNDQLERTEAPQTKTFKQKVITGSVNPCVTYFRTKTITLLRQSTKE